MKIKYKITIWVTAVGLIVILFFAGYTLYEAVDLSYEFMDMDIRADVLEDLSEADNMPSMGEAELFSTLLDFDESYWFKVFDDRMNLVYGSPLSYRADIPFRIVDGGEDGYNKEILMKGDGSAQAKQMVLRVNVVDVTVNGRPYRVQIAKDIEELEKEIGELVSIVSVGFVLASVLLIVLSHFLTGRILAPIVRINRLASEINASRLNRRIPLGRNRDELYVLSETLNRMFDRLQKSFDRQKQFTADAAHELKTPITMLLLFMEQVQARPDLPVGYTAQIGVQMDTLRRMKRLVKQMLDLSALDLREHLQVSEFNLSSLIRRVLEDFDIVFSAMGVRVTTQMPEPLPFHGDREKIQRILINLVDNAVKYNRENGQIEIEAIQEDDSLVLRVWNTGPGIPPEDLPHVFDTFFRVEKSRSHAYGGSGLGLAIVRSIVELHGGSVSMESQVNEWCRALVRLPMAG